MRCETVLERVFGCSTRAFGTNALRGTDVLKEMDVSHRWCCCKLCICITCNNTSDATWLFSTTSLEDTKLFVNHKHEHELMNEHCNLT